MKKGICIILKAIGYILFVFTVLLAFSCLWMLKTWPNLNMNELVFQLKQGFGGTGNDMLGSWFVSAGLPSLIVAVLMGIVLIIFHHGRGKQALCLTVSAILCLCLSGVSLYENVDVEEYVVSQSVESEFIQENYADPANVKLTFPEKKRNLIYIFLESMETTYADKDNGGAFDFNCIPELTEIAEENECFAGNHTELNGGYSMPATTWTMGGMFAETSGLPLKVSVNGNDMGNQSVFFPGIQTIGDILKDNGYTNRLLIGSDAEFGGRKLYFTSHGDYQIHDYVYSEENGEIPYGYYVWWGYEDNKLFDIAKENLNELSSKDEPFNLTMLTVDTHFEDGWECEDCPDTFEDNPYANVMACSSKKIAEFLSWCREQPWYEDTAIVLSGDHPTMDVDFCNNIDSSYERRVYTAFINSAAENEDPQRHRLYTTFDHFPTTLAAMGVEIEGERLGLGTNLFSGKDTLTEELGKEQEASFIRQKSRFMEQKSGVTVSISDLKKKGDSLIKADVTVKGYEEGVLTLNVDHIPQEEGILHNVRIMTENEEGTVYTDCVPLKDGSWQADLKISSEQMDLTHLKVIGLYEKNGKFFGESLFEYSGGDLLFISGVQNDSVGYMNVLKMLDPERYSILMSGEGNAAEGIDDSIQNALYELGFEYDIRNWPEASFYFAKNGDRILQDAGERYLERYGYTISWLPFIIVSGALESGNVSSIRISNGRTYDEYSLNEYGMNFVIWDNEKGEAVNTAAFDTRKKPASITVSVKNDDNSLKLSVNETENMGSVSVIFAEVFDEEHLRHKKTVQFEKEEDGTYTALPDMTDLTDAFTIRICVMDKEDQRYWFRLTAIDQGEMTLVQENR